MARERGGRVLIPWVSATLALAPAISGCSSQEEEPGKLVMTLYADMAIPKDVDAIQIEILSNGSPRPPTDPIQIGPGGQLLPATLTIVGNDDPATTATITVWSYSESRLQTLRRVVTQVPPARLSLLRVPIQWLCEGNVVDTGGVPISKCAEGQSCVAGECVDDDDNALPDYGTGDVYGGGDGKDPDTGSCFDTVSCLDQGFDVLPQMSDCTLALPVTDEALLNVGLVTELGDAGICGRKNCYVPFDKSELFGWSIDAGRIKLPLEACKRITDGKAKALRLATGPCQSKVVQVPTCGPWSSVNGDYTPQTSQECERLCSAVANASCKDDTAEKCFARCYPAAGVCDSIIDEYAKCGETNAFQTCSGTATRAVPSPSCALQTEAFQVCRKCAQAANDACDYCACGACQKEFAACDADAACATILACAERMHCRGSACDAPGVCEQEIGFSPAAKTLFEAIGACASQGCASCSGK